MSVKKLVFGKPEKIKPSRYCKKFNYCEGEISYNLSEIKFSMTKRGCVLEFPFKGDEHIYGLGLQLKQFDFKGKHAKLKVNCDPVAPTGDSHAPVPFFVSTSGYGVYFDTARYVEFDFGRRKKHASNVVNSDTGIKLNTKDLYSVQNTDDSIITVCIPVAKGIELYIFEGNTITDIISEYNRLSGGGCDVPEWGFGLYYRCCATYNQNQVNYAVSYFKEKKIPCSVIGIEPGWQTKSYPCSYEWNTALFPNPKKMIDNIYQQGCHINLWEHAFVNRKSSIYDKLKNYSGNYTVWDGLVPDFTIKKAREIFSEQHNENVDFGIIDGYKLDECDNGDYTGGWSFPDCSLFPSGADGEQYHSLFGTLYMQTVLQTLKGRATYSEVRNAGALCSSYPFVLYSDLYNHEDFIRGVVSSGFSGLLWTPEVRHADSKEEFVRRLQTAVFSAQCLINGWYCEEFPWLNFDCENELRRWVNEREKLKPYLKKAFEEYKCIGKPPIRALVCDYTTDENTYGIDDEYIFCDEFIVAPIKAGEESRKVYLPEGKWVNYFSGKAEFSGWFEVKTEDIPVYRKLK